MALERRAKPIEYVVLWNGTDISTMTQQQLRIALAQAGQEIDDLQTRLGEKLQKVDALQAKVDNLQERNDRLQARIAELEGARP